MYVKFFLLTALFAGSVFVWCLLVSRRYQRRPFLDLSEGPRAKWHSATELAVVYVAILWATASLLAFVRSSTPHQPVTLNLDSVAQGALLNIGLALCLSLVLVWGQGKWSAIGMTFSQFRDQLRVGIGGFFAAVLPMAISMALMIPFRGPENQHSLLKLLGESPEAGTVSLVVLAAVISAPLLEELLFRVILQGWLTTIFRPTLAIVIVAIVFSLVHGWRDGMALMPLALILGYVFDRRHSYLAIVVIHALFNATMLTLQLLSPQSSP